MFKKNEDEEEFKKKRTVKKLKCFAKKEYIEPEKRKNDITEPKKFFLRVNTHCIPCLLQQLHSILKCLY